jgi:hypothetical protein
MTVDKQEITTATTSNDIITHKLEGMINKLSIVALPKDQVLQSSLLQLLVLHKKIAQDLQKISSNAS